MPDIIINPNRGTLDDPSITFVGLSATLLPSASSMNLQVYPTGGLAFNVDQTPTVTLGNNFSSGTVFNVNTFNVGETYSLLQVYGSTESIVLGPNNSNVLVVSGTNVGIGTRTPNAKLTVTGSVSATNNVFTSGGNSDQWNLSYTTIITNSGDWSAGGALPTDVTANSANWDSTYTTVSTSSGSWGGVAIRAFTVENPEAGDVIPLWYTNASTTVTQVRAVLAGTTPVINTFILYYGADRNAAGTAFTTLTSINNFTTGINLDIINQPIPSNNYVWLSAGSTTGTVNYLNVSIEY